MSLKLLHAESQNRWVSEADGNYPTSGMPWEVSEFSLVRILYCTSSGSSVYGILQARILEWVAISFSRGSSWPRDRTPVSCVTDRFFTTWATRGAPEFYKQDFFFSECSLGSLQFVVSLVTKMKEVRSHEKERHRQDSHNGSLSTNPYWRRKRRIRSRKVGIKKGEKAGIYYE